MTDAELIASLDRDSTWVRTAWVRIDGDVGHPQGLTRWGEYWLVTTVHPAEARGELLAIDPRGRIVQRVPLVDGPRWHPGGLHADARGNVLVALAEYAPESSTSVWYLDTNLRPELRFTVDDHLGAVCATPRGVFAVSWGSSSVYLFDHQGGIVDAVANPSCFIDHQDVQLLGDGTVLTSGVGGYTTPRGRVQIGGYAGWDLDGLRMLFAVPVVAWVDSGRVLTYNPVHTDLTVESAHGGHGAGAMGRDGDTWSDGTQPGVRATVALHCLPDDTRGVLSTWTATTWIPAATPQ